MSGGGATPPVDLVLRRARRDDVADIVRLLADDVLGREREQPGPEVADAYWRAFDAIDADPRQHLLVAESGGRVVGTLQVSFIPSLTFTGGERAQIEGVRVDAGVRGAGVGHEMVGWVVDEAARRGCRMVQLTTSEQRSEARRFYESLGFTVTHLVMKRPL